MRSDIRVFVRWKEQSVFAGEEAQCTITFKNVADTAAEEIAVDGKTRSWSRRDSTHSTHSTHSRRLSNGLPLSPATPVPFSPSRQQPTERRHRTTASLSITPSSATYPRSPSWPSSEAPNGHAGQHQRSVSIVSMVGSEGGGDVPSSRGPPQTRRPNGGHGRSASLQVLPKSQAASQEAQKFTTLPRPQPLNRHPSLNHLDNARSNLQVPLRQSRRASGLRSPSISPTSSNGSRRASPHAPDFKFPAGSSPISDTDIALSRTTSSHTTQSGGNHSKSLSTQGHQLMAQSIAASRVISGASIDGSVRSSGEFYSVSNQSTDTVGSEQPQRPLFSVQSRMHSRVNSTIRPSQPEKLLMGYAQLNASFVVEGSLVDQAPFEEVKRKGFMGGQGGGGVVGVEKRKSTGGFLGSFNLSSISESLGGLLNPQDMSSSKEMKSAVSSRSVPLLSTPQSLLFVDMELKPGEQRSFSYSYRLPKGLPASHKGKAIKISYHLVIGTQFAGNTNNPQKVRSVNVPLRVFSGVNSEGEVLGHDLMYPYVVLRDAAKTSPLDEASSATPVSPSPQEGTNFSADFKTYAQSLVDRRLRRQSSAVSMDDTAVFTERRAKDSTNDSIELIRLAVLRSNQAAESERSPNRFEISRNGRYVGVVVLNRPFHRIGETIVASIDFAAAQSPTLSLRCTLETVEKVEPTLALRSTASINRATRKVHASQSENTLYARRVVFSPSIPVSATPTLYTSGVSMCWQLRFEFATLRSGFEANESGTAEPSEFDLLEDIGSDEKGTSHAAVENIHCDSFEVAIPLTVYGDIIKETEEDEILGLPI